MLTVVRRGAGYKVNTSTLFPNGTGTGRGVLPSAWRNLTHISGMPTIPGGGGYLPYGLPGGGYGRGPKSTSATSSTKSGETEKSTESSKPTSGGHHGKHHLRDLP